VMVFHRMGEVSAPESRVTRRSVPGTGFLVRDLYPCGGKSSPDQRG